MDDKSPGFRISNLARKVTNVDGKMLGKDGKPLLARRNVIHNTDIGSKATTDGSDTSKADDGVKQSSASGKDEMHDHATDVNVSTSIHVGSSNAVKDPSKVDSSDAGVKLGEHDPVKGDNVSFFTSSGPVLVSTADRSQSFNEQLKFSFASVVSSGKSEAKVTFGKEESLAGPKPPSADASNASAGAANPSFASVGKDDKPKPKMNFRKVVSSAGPDDDYEAMIPISSVKEVANRLNNSVYGYFIGKRIAFPVVENYVRNTWGKFGIQKVMMNAKGFYFFKFASPKGVDDVLENGPWMIRTVPIILNKWTPSACLTKENHDLVPVWVKIHDVPLAAFTADGLSVIASRIGNPLRMDAYTSAMCEESWGRSSYARVMIEICAKDKLKEEVTVAVPNFEEDGYFCASCRIEFEWRPPQCGECNIFGHANETCPKLVKPKPQVTKDSGKQNVSADGFQQVKPKPFRGLVVGKQKNVSVGKTKKMYVPKNQNKEAGKTSTSNSFETLNKFDPNVDIPVSANKNLDVRVEDKQIEDRGKKVETSSTGFCTLADDGKERKTPSLYEKWKQTDDYEDDDSDDVLDPFDYDMTDYLDSQDRQGRRKS